MKKENEFFQPDPRFPVWAARLQMPSGPVYVFSAASERRAPHRTEWRTVEGAAVVLIGVVDDALAALIGNYPTKWWSASPLALHPQTLTALRRHLGISADWAAGTHGGRRPGAGRPTSKQE